MGKKKAVSVYFEESLLNDVKDYAAAFGSRQFNRVVNDACREMLDAVARKSSYGSVYAMYIPDKEIVKIGSSQDPIQRMAILANCKGFDKYETYISESTICPALWEFISHWEMGKLGLHEEGEYFNSDLSTAVEIIEGNKPSWERSRRFIVGTNQKFGDLCAKHGLTVKLASKRLGFTPFQIGKMMRDKDLAEDIESVIIEKFDLIGVNIDRR